MYPLSGKYWRTKGREKPNQRATWAPRNGGSDIEREGNLQDDVGGEGAPRVQRTIRSFWRR